jgi:uncharacterized membrane protein
MLHPLPFPAALNESSNLKLLLGIGLFLAGMLIFSIWKERLFSLKEDERTKFLMFNLMGGAWIFAIFAACGGVYFLFDSLFKFAT